MTSRNLRAVLTQLRPARLQGLLCDLVDVYSPTYAEEPATAVLEAALCAAGLRPQRQAVANPLGNAPRHNLLVRLGPEPLGLLLVGHVDTIPAGPGPMQFAPAQVQGEHLIGLGAADMKSGCAAMVEALAALVASGVPLRRGVGLALVVGEEEYGDGTAALPAGLLAPLTLIGEPTSLSPCTEHYGYLECELHSRGSRAHAAVPGNGTNAIHAMLSWLLGALDNLGNDPLADGISMNPRLIQGGSPLFVVADACEATLDVHWRPGIDVAAIRTSIEAARQTAAAGHPGCQLELKELFAASGFSNHADAPPLRVLQDAFDATELPWLPGVFRSHSDADMFQQRGSVTVVCGPGALEAAHAPGESVALREVQRAARLYAALAALVCCGPDPI